jgi:hypothetical protein
MLLETLMWPSLAVFRNAVLMSHIYEVVVPILTISVNFLGTLGHTHFLSIIIK